MTSRNGEILGAEELFREKRPRYAAQEFRVLKRGNIANIFFQQPGRLYEQSPFPIFSEGGGMQPPNENSPRVLYQPAG
jgi:hypothetical protein